MKYKTPHFAWLSIGLVMTLAGCQSDPSTTTVDYLGSRTPNSSATLSIPPGLSEYEVNSKFDLSQVISGKKLEQGDTSGSNTKGSKGVKGAKGSKGQSAVDSSLASSMTIERTGNTRWLVVNRSQEEVWQSLENFWLDSGFTLKTNQANIGIMETDWAENKGAIPKTGLSRLIGSVAEFLYDSGLRDMYRTRVEKTARGVEIYISHRGMEEVYTNASKEQTQWQSRSSDPELEAEMLRRLMVALGTDKATAKAAVDNPVSADKGVRVVGNSLVVDDTLENTWRRVGQTLDRAGLSIIDRDITRRVFYVTPNPDDRGLFRKDFGKLKETYQVQFVANSPSQVQVNFADKAGKAYVDEGLARVLEKLQEGLR